jgi:hypothetical protein
MCVSACVRVSVCVWPPPSVSADNVWVTAVKKEDGAANAGVAVRLFGVGPAAQPDVAVTLDTPGAVLSRALRTNLIELDGVVVPGAAGGTNVTLDVGAWAIETMVLHVQGVAP